MSTTTAAPPRRPSRAQRRGVYPCPVPAGATPDLMAAFQRAMSAAELSRTFGSSALDLPYDAAARSSIAEPSRPTIEDHDEPARQRRELDHELVSRRRFWPSVQRWDEILGSEAAFLASFAVSWVLSGVLAYFYALWTIGPV